MLKKSALNQACPTRIQQLSEGVFWFCIAVTLLLAMLDARLSGRAPVTLSVAWAGVFVVYYAARLSLTPLYRRSSAQAGQPAQPDSVWRRSAPLLLDLLVITGLVALSGGLMSPLYVLYLGWAAALLAEPSPIISLCFSGVACGTFVLGVFLPPHQPFSMLQSLLLAEHAFLLLVVGLGISGARASLKRAKSAWEAERRQWDALRQSVFAQLSHELYTPLSAISASAALLAEMKGPMPERQGELLRVIERNCARMNLLLDDLLALWKEPQRQSAVAPQRLRSLVVAQAVGQMLGPLFDQKEQRLVVAVEPEDVCVLAERERLEQVLVNLLVNAQTYAPPGAAITLTITAKAREVLFAVHDDGVGVPLEEQRHLFDMLYRGTNSLASSRGSGIGLALAKALVVLQGGRIWVESLPGRGSTFYFTMPAAEPG
jgi:signal transduction histidine kinase